MPEPQAHCSPRSLLAVTVSGPACCRWVLALCLSMARLQESALSTVWYTGIVSAECSSEGSGEVCTDIN